MLPRFRFEPAERGTRLMISGPPEGQPILVCLPCAGGSASGFRALAMALPESWRVVALDLPGHGLVRDAPAPDRIDDMLEICDAVLSAELDRGAYLFGHSLGGLLAFLLASRREREGRPVRGVMVGAARAPSQVFWERWSLVDDEELIARLETVGGIPRALQEDRDLLRTYLPAVRADFRALEHWYIGRRLTPIHAPLWVLAGAKDGYARPDRVREWAKLSTKGEFVLMSGGHFFPQDDAAELAGWLTHIIG